MTYLFIAIFIVYTYLCYSLGQLYGESKIERLYAKRYHEAKMLLKARKALGEKLANEDD